MMNLETAADVQKLQAAFVKSVNASASKLLENAKLRPQDVLDDKRQRLTEMQAQLRETTDARAAFERAYDREIAQREATIANLEAELKEDARDTERLRRNVGVARAPRKTPGRKKRL
jgi:predicted RNase H-like nuclease (RuvC/YqgF family)